MRLKAKYLVYPITTAFTDNENKIANVSNLVKESD